MLERLNKLMLQRRSSMHGLVRPFRTRVAVSMLVLLPLAAPAISRAQQSAPPSSPKPLAYELQSGDTIAVFYRITPEYNQSLTILPDGDVDLRLVGPVHLAGLDVEQARQAILDKAGRVLKDPEVSVSVTDFVREQFTVMGEVAKAGRFELHGTTTIADGLALAGGFTQVSAQRKVVLVRPLDPSSEYGRATVFDFKQLTRLNANTSRPPSLQNGDIIIVTTSKFAKIQTVIKLVNVGLYYNPLPSI
jgi:polysaccharide export outer membrane protein